MSISLAFLDPASLLGIIRGDHIAAAVLGATPASVRGQPEDWKSPSKTLNGMNAAPEAADRARGDILVMKHAQRHANPASSNPLALSVLPRGFDDAAASAVHQ